MYFTGILLCQVASLLLALRYPLGSVRGRIVFACVFWMCVCACVFSEGEVKLTD